LRAALACAVLLLLPPAASAATTRSSCIECHGLLEDGTVGEWERDAHAAAGLGCESCHGGDPSPDLAEDPEAAMAEARGFRAAPGRLEIPRFCGECHADAEFIKRFDPQARIDQLAEYRTSVHGKRNAAGDPVPAVCTDCHGVHGIRAVAAADSPVHANNVPQTCARCHVDQAVMQPYGIPTDQYRDYSQSAHAAALLDREDTAAPACNDCHGNHGASPPGVDSVANVCGQCHAREASLFRDSIKQDLFEALETGECTSCHGHHLVRHPTPELFHGGSAPQVSAGRVLETAPFAAELGDLPAGGRVEAAWTATLAPYLEPDDERLRHGVAVAVAGSDELELDATVLPGAVPDPQAPLRAGTPRLSAVLAVEALSGVPVKAGDSLRFRLTLEALGEPLRGVVVTDRPAPGVEPMTGSVCLTCHSPGDACDEATARMYEAIAATDVELRQAEAMLHRAEVAGMDVGDVQFDLKSRGTTAALDARALTHSFDPDAFVARAQESRDVAREALQAGRAALDELRYRRQGLAVSLVLIALVLAALYLKIRDLDREPRRTTNAGDDA
jgi:hypothetical protein